MTPAQLDSDSALVAVDAAMLADAAPEPADSVPPPAAERQKTTVRPGKQGRK